MEDRQPSAGENTTKVQRVQGLSVQRLRLASGLVLLAYVATHFLNHALGLRSLAVMESGQWLFLAVWRSLPGSALLYSAVAIHLAMALVAIYRRDRLNTLRGWEMAQLATGLLIPLILVQHVIGTRAMHELFGVNDSYSWTLLVMWKYLPYLSWLQPVTMLLVWLHACIGIHFWLRLKPGYPSWKPWLFAAGVLIPTLGLLGFIDGGLTVRDHLLDPQWEEAVRLNARAPSAAAIATAEALTARARIIYLALVALAFFLRWVRLRYRKYRSEVHLQYDNGQQVRVAAGTSILDASREVGIPHASVCGGRGRCSTCRVRVGEGSQHLPPPGDQEMKVLARVGAPPNVRLACQLRPTRSLEITRLLPPMTAGPEHGRRRPGYVYGEEKEIAVLFADIRGFTALSEHKLPFDVVFILNRYFTEMGHAVEAAGGRLDKFIGDGVMALFGVERGPVAGTRSALQAARNMQENLVELNRSLEDELPGSLRIGIGIHTGPAIIGEMGYGNATGLTAIGDTVNTASRLEAATKRFGVPLIISAAASRHAGESLGETRVESIEVAGRVDSINVHLVDDPVKSVRR